MNPVRIATISPEQALGLSIRVDDDNADVLTGYRGGVLVLEDTELWTYAGQRREGHYVVPPTCYQHDIICDDAGLRHHNVRLPAALPHVHDHVVRLLLREVRHDKRSPMDLRWAINYEGDGETPDLWISAAVVSVALARRKTRMYGPVAVYGPRQDGKRMCLWGPPEIKGYETSTQDDHLLVDGVALIDDTAAGPTMRIMVPYGWTP